MTDRLLNIIKYRGLHTEVWANRTGKCTAGFPVTWTTMNPITLLSAGTASQFLLVSAVATFKSWESCDRNQKNLIVQAEILPPLKGLVSGPWFNMLLSAVTHLVPYLLVWGLFLSSDPARSEIMPLEPVVVHQGRAVWEENQIPLTSVNWRLCCESDSFPLYLF